MAVKKIGAKNVCEWVPWPKEGGEVLVTLANERVGLRLARFIVSSWRVDLKEQTKNRRWSLAPSWQDAQAASRDSGYRPKKILGDVVEQVQGGFVMKEQQRDGGHSLFVK